MNEPHNQELCELARRHFNEPMLSFGELARCIGYGETAIDCYIIVQKIGGAIFWNTCVGGYIFLDRLKGQNYVKAYNGEDWDDIFRLDCDLVGGGAPRVETFVLDLQHDDWEGMAPQEDVAVA